MQRSRERKILELLRWPSIEDDNYLNSRHFSAIHFLPSSDFVSTRPRLYRLSLSSCLRFTFLPSTEFRQSLSNSSSSKTHTRNYAILCNHSALDNELEFLDTFVSSSRLEAVNRPN